MKKTIKELILKAAKRAYNDKKLPNNDFPTVVIEEPKHSEHGDYSTSFAMMSASLQKMPPRKIAEVIIGEIDEGKDLFSDILIAGPGFINFYIRPVAWHPTLNTIHQMDRSFGSSSFGQGEKIQVEFVSANPTGPLHVGHGRGAAVGDTLANIMAFVGYDVQREYYINDSGRQIRTLGKSVYLRMLELHGREVVFPDDCYQGAYIVDIANQINRQQEIDIDSLSEEEAISRCARFAADHILAGIHSDLRQFGIDYDLWFSEQSLHDKGIVQKTIDDLFNRDLVYSKDDAMWFRSERFGDEKDRVVVRQNGLTTYFASDIAYHADKYARGFERVIDIWGADHHGYIPRMTAAVQALGKKSEHFDVILVRLVNLLRAGEPVAMSTRAGEFVTLKTVLEEVGKDAARFIFLTRHYDSALDFDLEVAKKKTNDNPVYYVQYVHARIASMLKKSGERGLSIENSNSNSIKRLTTKEEIGLMKQMSHFPEVVLQSAREMAPHRIAFYLIDLAAAFHSYYNKHRVINDDPILSQGRLYLVAAIKKVIRNGLGLLGVNAPERM